MYRGSERRDNYRNETSQLQHDFYSDNYNNRSRHQMQRHHSTPPSIYGRQLNSYNRQSHDERYSINNQYQDRDLGYYGPHRYENEPRYEDLYHNQRPRQRSTMKTIKMYGIDRIPTIQMIAFMDITNIQAAEEV